MNSHYYYKQYDENNIRVICSRTDLLAKKEKTKVKFEDYNKTESEEIKRISISRVKRKIRELLLCNDWDYFCTWTVDSEKCDRYSLQNTQDNIRKLFQKLSRDQRLKGYGKCDYLFVTEKHKDGAFHFHGVMKNVVLGNYLNDNKYLSNKYFDTLGFHSFSKIQNKTACANYIMKYITKDSIQNEKGTYYFRSHGLKKPEKLNEIYPLDFNRFISPYGEIMYYENEFMKVCDLQIDRLPSYVSEYLFYNFIDK